MEKLALLVKGINSASFNLRLAISIITPLSGGIVPSNCGHPCISAWMIVSLPAYPIASILSIPITTSDSAPIQVQFYIVVISAIITYFIIGALIGLIIGKFKNKNQTLPASNSSS